MREPYFPVFKSIVDSTLWALPGDTIKVFFTLMAKSDPEGCVSTSLDGIRRAADMPANDVAQHLETLASPEAGSKDRERDPAADGSRIEKIPGGWKIRNLEFYREQARQEAEKARKRRHWQQKAGPERSARRLARRTQTETETQIETKTKKKKKSLPSGESASAPTRSTSGVDRKTFLPDKRSLKVARSLNFSGEELKGQLEEFRDHEPRRPYKTLDGAFRNWLRRTRKWDAERGTVKDRRTASHTPIPRDGNSYSDTSKLFPATRKANEKFALNLDDRQLMTIQSLASLKARGRKFYCDSLKKTAAIEWLASRLPKHRGK